MERAPVATHDRTDIVPGAIWVLRSPNTSASLQDFLDARVAERMPGDTLNGEAAVGVLAGDDAWAASILQALRRCGMTTPILILRTSHDASGACDLLDAGADACLPGDCAPRVFSASLRALARRGPSRWEGGGPEIELDAPARTLRIRGEEFAFGPVAFRVVRHLVENRDRWVSQQQIIESALGTHHAPDSSVARVQIHQIRKTLGSSRHYVRRDGRRGCGYMFTLRPEVPAPIRCCADTIAAN